MYRLLVIVLGMVMVLSACKKTADKVGLSDDRINERTYCNDPSAVNYNWGFPGKPDNTTCFYPTEVFKGSFVFADSMYDVNYLFTGERTVTLKLDATDYTHLNLTGFCNDNTSLPFTADKFFKATADTTIYLDSTKVGGQPLCRPVDTLSGYIMRGDDSSTSLRINFTVHSDTGISYHIGTAIKQ